LKDTTQHTFPLNKVHTDLMKDKPNEQLITGAKQFLGWRAEK